MLFQFRDASDQLLFHWTRSSKQSDHFLQQTEDFLEEVKSSWLSEREYRQLYQLLQQKEVDLVYRYLELQLSFRMSEERDQQHISIELENKLENYLKNADYTLLKREVALALPKEVTHIIIDEIQKVPKLLDEAHHLSDDYGLFLAFGVIAFMLWGLIRKLEFPLEPGFVILTPAAFTQT